MTTLLVCNRCGRSEEFSQAIANGWLNYQMKNAPESYLVIRCPDHITGHALRLAGLPQQVLSKRVAQNIERGLYFDDGNTIFAASERLEVDGCADGYGISYHYGERPAYHIEPYTTLRTLIQAMRKIEKDLRKWRLCK